MNGNAWHQVNACRYHLFTFRNIRINSTKDVFEWNLHFARAVWLMTNYSTVYRNHLRCAFVHRTNARPIDAHAFDNLHYLNMDSMRHHSRLPHPPNACLYFRCYILTCLVRLCCRPYLINCCQQMGPMFVFVMWLWLVVPCTAPTAHSTVTAMVTIGTVVDAVAALPLTAATKWTYHYPVCHCPAIQHRIKVWASTTACNNLRDTFRVTHSRQRHRKIFAMICKFQNAKFDLNSFFFGKENA